MYSFPRAAQAARGFEYTAFLLLFQRATQILTDRGVAKTCQLFGKLPMSKKEIFIEKHENGFAVLRPNAERASAICPTQAEAIERAAQIDPAAQILVERVRHTDAGHPDQWRKP